MPDGVGEHPPGQDPSLPASAGGGARARGGVSPGEKRGQIELADDFDAPLDELYEALR
jgi:hypothetical protein